MWVKLDDGFFDHPKAIAAGPQARELVLASWCWASRYLTDGHIPAGALPMLAAKAGVTPNRAGKLLEVGLWTPNGDGFEIHDYLSYNPSRSQIADRSETRRKAGAKGAHARWHRP